MQLALVTHGVPEPGGNGAAMTCWALLRQALDDGHSVSVVVLAYPRDEAVRDPGRQDAVRATGAELALLPITEAELEPASPQDVGPLAAVVPAGRAAERMRGLLDSLGPDAVFAYHWDGIAATHRYAGAPRFGGVDDPWHLPELRRWQQARPRPTIGYGRWTWRTLRARRPTTRAMVALLADCEAAGAFQARTATWLREAGAGACAYLPAPLADPIPEGPPPRLRSDLPRILIGPSQLRATTTSAGLRFFARRVLPALERELGSRGFRVDIVGAGEPPPDVTAELARPAVHVRGWVDDIAAEYAAADIQLAPTPFVLGKRMRLIEGLAYGSCIVAHEAEAANLPELVDGRNVVLGANGEEIARAVATLIRDPDRRAALGAEARRTYERHFHPSVAARAIVERLEQLAGADRALAEC